MSSVHCACRDCFDTATNNDPIEEQVWSEESEDWITYTRTPPAFCWECEEAGCEIGTDCQRHP